ncbi:MAG: hypothetical protein ABI867_41220 [Kofleriaceae bacterium]
MRSWILVMVIACGSKDEAKPPPPPEPKASKALEDAAAKIDELTAKVCACKTSECGTAVNTEMTAWADALAKQPPDPAPAPLELRNRMTDRLNRFSTCLRAVAN